MVGIYTQLLLEAIRRIPVERILFPTRQLADREKHLTELIEKLEGKPTEAEVEVELKAACEHISKVKGWVESGKVAEAVVADKVKKIVGE